jgi:polar amino acid transport system substrate-binding protein
MLTTRRRVLAAAIAASTTYATRYARGQTQLASAAATLCPTGKLRAALIRSNPVLVTLRPDGVLGGVSVTVARALAEHLGVPIELKPYDNPARYNESLETDKWDVGLAARDPLRADHLAFSATFMEVDNGYVARAGVALTSADDVDRPGIRIAVAQASAPHTVLRRLIKQAEIVPIPGGFEAARDALAKGEADIYGENLHLAYRIADAVPGAHVLPGRFNVVQMAIGVRKRAATELPAVDEFVNRIRVDGTVQKAITEAGLKGVRVP